MVVNHEFKYNLAHNNMDVIWDHQGNIITKSGSQLQGINGYLKKSDSPYKSPPHPATKPSLSKKKNSIPLVSRKTIKKELNVEMLLQDQDDDDSFASLEPLDNMDDHYKAFSHEWGEIRRQSSVFQVRVGKTPLKQPLLRKNTSYDHNEEFINIFNKNNIDTQS